jgi:hypothetical protein
MDFPSDKAVLPFVNVGKYEAVMMGKLDKQRP